MQKKKFRNVNLQSENTRSVAEHNMQSILLT